MVVFFPCCAGFFFSFDTVARKGSFRNRSVASAALAAARAESLLPAPSLPAEQERVAGLADPAAGTRWAGSGSCIDCGRPTAGTGKTGVLGRARRWLPALAFV